MLRFKFIQNKELGYNKEHVINFETTGMNGDKQQAFLKEVRKVNGVKKAAGVSHALFGATKAGANITWNGKDPEQEVWFEWGFVGYDLLELTEIKLERGRFFSRDFGDEESRVVINKTTQQIMGVDDPLGKKLMVGENEYEIIGVTEDFHFQSLHEKIKPTFFLLNSRWTMQLAMRIDQERMDETIDAIQTVYTTFNPGFPFEYTFHDQDKLELYATEEKVTILSKYAAGLAILISSLGLFGLVSFVAERKAKELGIRKVLGASSRALFGSLSREFVQPIAIASFLGILISTYVMNEWLNKFAYSIGLNWWLFIAGVLLMLAIALATTLSQILKAIQANPVNVLKDE
ncbi:MAG: FtsX-like permease family protein [Bacteroidota bacterium]